MKAVNTHFMRKNGRQQHRMAMVYKQGRKWTHVVFVEYPVQIEKVLNKDAECFHVYPNSVTRNLHSKLKHMAKLWYGRKSNAPKNVQLALWGA